MSFKKFYSLNVEQYIFHDTFEKYYKKGFFGDVDIDLIRENQKEWFDTFLKIVNERNELELLHSLINTENRLTREWFSLLTGYNIKYTTKQKAMSIVREFIHGKQK